MRAKIKHLLLVSLLFTFISFGGMLGPPGCSDNGTMYYPQDSHITQPDSAVLRAILDSNGLQFLNVDTVSTGEYGRVVALDLSTQNLDSFYFPEIAANLEAMRTMNLGRNRLSGVPANVWLLEFLQELILDSNRISAFPAEFFSDSNTAPLYPGRILFLRNLKTLSLSYNRLDSIPATIQNLTTLQRIRLISNPLRDLPLEIGNIASLLESTGDTWSGYNGLDVTYDHICNPSPGLDSLLDRFAKRDWRVTQICPAPMP